MLTWLIENLKWLICRRELETLWRYDTACEEAMRWLVTSDPEAAATADWIKHRATEHDCSIDVLRDAFQDRKARRAAQQ